jgi:hypothetical protein
LQLLIRHTNELLSRQSSIGKARRQVLDVFCFALRKPSRSKIRDGRFKDLDRLGEDFDRLTCDVFLWQVREEESNEAMCNFV